MKTSLKRLLSLNLALLMLLTLLPVTAAAADTVTVNLDHPSWSGWGKVSVKVGPILMGGETVVSAAELTSTKSGTGWTYSAGVLTLHEDYPGLPIQAEEGLVLAVDGNVSITADDGPALSTGGTLFLKANKSATDGSGLRINGAANSHAVVLPQGKHYAQYPFFLEISAQDPYDAMRIGNGHGNFYFSLKSTLFAGNGISTLSHTTSSSNLQPDRSVQPYGSYLTLGAENDESLWFRLTIHPMEGTIDGLEPQQTADYEFYLPEMTKVSYNTVQFPGITLPEVTREGHLLLGWWPAPHGGLTDFYYQPGDPIITDVRSNTMYALWQETPGDSYIFVDGNGTYIYNDDPHSGQPRYAIPLVDGTAILPDQNRASLNFLGWSTTPMEEIDLNETLAVDGLYQPGEAVELPHGTILYAVYGSHPSVTLHGNGHTTPAGKDTVQARHYYAGETSSWNLLVYGFDLQNEEIFTRNGQAVLDFNAAADGSGVYSPYAMQNAYAQWADAPAGSILLYSRRGATADGRYGKVILPDEAASFDLTAPNGFEWPHHVFQGWKVPSLSGNILTQLPAANASGLIQLESVWRPYQIRYMLDKTSFKYASYTTQRADDDGVLTPRAPYSTASGYLFNGWNTKADGSGTGYLPKQEVTLPGDLTLYEQVLSLPSGEASVLVEDFSGAKLYNKVTGTEAAGNSKQVTVALPASPGGFWTYKVDSKEQNATFGFSGGSTATLPKGAKLYGSDGYVAGVTFQGNGGTFAYGSTFRSLVYPCSYSNLTTYPTQADFTSVPDGATLGGWSTDAVVTESSTIYEPGRVVNTSHTKSAPLYAVWDSANVAYITFVDKDSTAGRDESFTRRHTAGSTIDLPIPQRSGYPFKGWSDGVTTYPAGSSYTVPAGDTTLTALWETTSMLIVDGVAYDPTVEHDHSNGETQGWKYVPYGQYDHNLYLYNYTGGPIFVPHNLKIYLNGTNVVSGTTTSPAISCTGTVSFHDDSLVNGYGSITVTGGAGMPAVSSPSANIWTKGSVRITGGAGAPAVKTGYFLLEGSHTVLQGGAGAPAYERNNSYSDPGFNTYVRYFAGADAASATELTVPDDYTDQPYLRTEPVTHTITLVGNGGTVNGREVWTQTFASGDNFKAEDFLVDHKNGILTGWLADDGMEFGVNSGFTVRKDRVLTAQWDVIPYDSYITLDSQGVGTVDGQRITYIDLSADTVTLPEPVEHEGSTLEFFTWQGQNSAGNWVEVPAGKAVDSDIFEPGMKLMAAYRNDEFAIVYFNLNGATPYDEAPISNYRNWGSSDVEVRSWLGNRTAEGWVIDHWNTQPDGSGDRYQPGGTITVPDGVYNTMLYAQWKPVLTYTTKTANEVLPGWNADIHAYVTTPDGQWLNDLVAWRSADGTRFYTPGEACGLPAGTKLYAYCVETDLSGLILLHGNGADGSVSVMPSIMWGKEADDTYTRYDYYIYLNQTGYTRDGYTLTGWNTKADGSGTAYGLDHTFYYATEQQLPGGDWEFVVDEAAAARMPDALYAQWVKAPSAEIIVPLDMRQAEHAVIYAAVYNADGSFAGIQTVSAENKTCALYDTTAGMTYQFFCMDAASAQPLTTAERGTL